MKNILEYRGYWSKVEYSSEDHLLYGKIEGIRDLVNFEGEGVSETEKAFKEAVDDYLEFCSSVGKEPDIPYKGSFNVRVSTDLHRRLALEANRNGESLNRFVEKALKSYVDKSLEDTTSNVVEATQKINAPRNVTARHKSRVTNSKFRIVNHNFQEG